MYDAIIIGRGPAGLSAAIYTVRANLKTLVVGKEDSVLRKAAKIENYFGFSTPVSGAFLLNEAEKQVLRLGAEIVGDEVVGIEKNDYFEVDASKGRYRGKAVLLATGQPRKKLKIENLAVFEGKGVSYCSTCDGFFYKNLRVGVLGYKDYALHEAIELLAYTKDITLFTNGQELELSEEYKEDAGRFRVNTKPIERFEGSEFLEKIRFKDGTAKELDGVFIAYESASSLDFARKLGILTEDNAILVDKNQETNLAGLFAAGDCTGGLRQIATAVGQGALAGKKMSDYIRSL